MNVNKPVSCRTLTSDLEQIDAHHIASHEYEELPELTEDMLASAKLKRWAPLVSQSAQIYLLAPAPGSHRALACHRPRLADSHGGALNKV